MPPPTTGKISLWTFPPLTWSFHLLAGTAAALALWGRIPPGFYLGSCLLSIMLWLAVGLIWATGMLIQLVMAVQRSSGTEKFRGWKHGLVAPLLLLSTILLIHYNLPFSVAFALSHPEMEQFVSETKQTPSPTPQQPQWLGFYRVDNATVMPWGVRFYLHSGWDTTYGFAYSSQGTPPEEHGSNLSTDRYIPITGNWYEWQHHEDW